MGLRLARLEAIDTSRHLLVTMRERAALSAAAKALFDLIERDQAQQA